MSALLVKLGLLVLVPLVWRAIRRAAESGPAAPPPLPVSRASYRPRRRAAVRTAQPVQDPPSAPAGAPRAVTAPPVAAASVASRRRARFHFCDQADLRRAFVASEVLGRPLALRPPRL